MNFKVFIFAILIVLSLNRRIRHPRLISITLSQKGHTLKQTILENFANNLTISFQLSEDQRNLQQKENQKTLHLDRLHYAYQVAYIPLRNFYNAQYFGKIELGSELKQFEVLFDTGSSFTWVTSWNCQTCQEMGIKHSFNCKESQTCQLLDKKVKLEYGTGKAKAQLMVDDIVISTFTSHNQTMLILDELTELNKFEGDGLAGLGFDTLSQGYPTLIDNLYNQGQIQNKEFSFYLSERTSKLIIGGVDESYADQTDKWHYCNVINNNYWAVLGDYVAFVSKDGNTRRSLNAIQPVHTDEKKDLLLTSLFVIDSGTSVIALYQEDYQRLLDYLIDFGIECSESLQYEGIFQCGDSEMDDFPNFEISLCGKTFTLPPRKYLLCDFLSCYLLIQPFDQRVSILGDLFISEFYTHFKQEAPRQIGFKKAI